MPVGFLARDVGAMSNNNLASCNFLQNSSVYTFGFSAAAAAAVAITYLNSELLAYSYVGRRVKRPSL